MNRYLEVFEEDVIRTFLVGGMAVGLGYLFFGRGVFDIRMILFEFVSNGVTIALAYTAFKSNQVRNGLVSLLVWYFILVAFVYVPHNNWMPIMEASYVLGLTAAVYIYFLLGRKHLMKGWLQRIAFAVILIGLTHGFIFVFLQLITLKVFVHPLETLGWSFTSLKYGAVIGLLCAVGMELSEHVISSRFLHRSVSV